MNKASDVPATPGALSFDYELDAPPAKVWRALTAPEFVAKWLNARIEEEASPREAASPERPPSAPISLRLLAAEPGRSVRYLWREEDASLPDSIVTFRISPSEAGGTRFRILHETTRAFASLRPANRNAPRLLLAA